MFQCSYEKLLRPSDLCPEGFTLTGPSAREGTRRLFSKRQIPTALLWESTLTPQLSSGLKFAWKGSARGSEGCTAASIRRGAILARLGIPALNGAVLDLGLSSDQLDDPERGFSFRFTGPLDMRFDTTSGEGLTEYLQNTSAKKLEEILATYGEERYCKKLARGIMAASDRGELVTTDDLARIVTQLLGGRRGRIHPATRTFQALRIAVNRELERLDAALVDIPLMLAADGRFCVVSYHSLEDRAVKLSFQQRRTEPQRWRLVTRKPLRPSAEESRTNPRARSARMRVLESLQGPSGSLE